MTADQKKILSRNLIYAFYAAAMITLIFYAWDEQTSATHGRSDPLYRNIRECPAYIKKGFDPADLLKIPEESGEWKRLENPTLRVINSSLELPKRIFLSPWGSETQEFTINILLDMDSKAITFLEGNLSVVPGLFIFGIGENWQIYLNGKLVRDEMHLDETGRIKERRTWYNVYFPMDRSLVLPGTNILSLRILGDPTYTGTGVFSQKAPVYFDDYKVIEGRQSFFLKLVLCGIFIFTGVYYLMLYFSIKKREEIFNLFFALFSILLFIYGSISQQEWVYSLIPNSDITNRMEYGSLMLAAPMLGVFLESLVVRKVSKPSRGYILFCIILCMTQIFFCNQYGEELILVWDLTAFCYFTYIILVLYIFYFRSLKKNKGNNAKEGNTGESSDLPVDGVLIGLILCYICALFDILDALFIRTSIRLFTYSIFAVHIGMVFVLSQRFSGMYNRLEQSNAMLEIAVHERTEELEKQTMIAIQASMSKSNFLARTSHEIRTPMNAITGMAELLLRSNLSGDARGYAQDIKNAGNNLVSIINDILDFSKIEAGKLEIVSSNYLLSSLINDTVNIIRTRLMEKPLRFFTNIDGSIPNSLSGDEPRLRQILLNLLSNGVKYSEKGYIGLTITTDRRDDKQIWLRIIVSDTGKGIKPEDQKKLFDEFVKVDVKKNQGIEGTGLGLAITKSLCTAMGGDISMESEYGSGSVFTAIIPQGIESDEPFAMVENAGEKKVLVYEGRINYAKSVCWTLENLKVPHTMVTNQNDFAAALYREEWFYVFSGYGLYEKIEPLMNQSDESFTGGKKPPLALMIEWGTEAFIPGVRFVSIPVQSLSIANVLNGKADSKGYVESYGAVRFIFPGARLLVVDDIATNLKVAEGLLSPYQAAVDTCTNGLQAIEMVKRAALENRGYDIIFMDHMMPEMDGIEATAVIRSLEGEYFRTVPIIALTANAVVGMREMFIGKGFNDFLSKPIDVSKLDEMLDRWIPKKKRTIGNEDQGDVINNSLLPNIPGVDTANGISMTGGTLDKYMQVLGLFCKDVEERLPLLQKAPDVDNLYAFIIHAHSLKSVSASIGAQEISDKSAAFEAAGRAGDMVFIREKLPGFVEQLTELVKNVRAALQSNKAAAPNSESFAAYSTLFLELSGAIKSQKISDIKHILNTIEQQAQDSKLKEVLEQISDQILMTEFDAALKIVEKVIAEYGN